MTSGSNQQVEMQVLLSELQALTALPNLAAVTVPQNKPLGRSGENRNDCMSDHT